MSVSILLPLGFKPVFKHGEHDQSSHGAWANGQNGESAETTSDRKGVGYKESDKHPKYDFNSEDGPNIEHYTSQGYDEINRFLRTGKSDPMGEEPDDLREYIRSLDKALNETSAPRDMVVYRGTSGVTKFDSLKEGDVFTDKAFVSTTTDLDTVWQFMSTATGDSQFDSRPFEKGYVLEISVPKGNRIFSVNNYFSETSGKYGPADDIRSENEHILPRSSKFKVDSIGTIDVRGAKDKLIRVSVVKDDK